MNGIVFDVYVLIVLAVHASYGCNPSSNNHYNATTTKSFKTTKAKFKYQEDVNYRGKVVDPSSFTSKKPQKNKELPMVTTTVIPATDALNLNNDTSISNVSTSPQGSTETTTVQMISNHTTTIKSNNNALTIIISSVSGIAITSLVIIAIWIRCWIKRSPQGAPGLLTNTHAQPFYVNLLFRKECAEEIAAIEQQHYEEINVQVPEASRFEY